MKSLKFILLAALTISSLISCDSNEYQDPGFQTAGDIYVRTIKIEDEVVHAPVIYVYSNKALFSATVNHSDNDDISYNLVDDYEGINSLRSVPLASDFTTTDVENGIYEFEITSTDNEVIKLRDQLLNDRMETINITEFNYEIENHKFDITWDEIENADIYVVKLLSGVDENILFSSTSLTTNTYSFDTNNRGWFSNPIEGTTYTLAVSAYLLESQNTASSLDINHETVEYKEIVW